MTDLTQMGAAAAAMSEAELCRFASDFDLIFRRKSRPATPADDELPDPTDAARRPVSQTTGD